MVINIQLFLDFAHLSEANSLYYYFLFFVYLISGHQNILPTHFSDSQWFCGTLLPFGWFRKLQVFKGCAYGDRGHNSRLSHNLKLIYLVLKKLRELNTQSHLSDKMIFRVKRWSFRVAVVVLYIKFRIPYMLDMHVMWGWTVFLTLK